MAIRKYVAISYCFAFLFVYFSSIAYALLSTSINQYSNKNMLPQTAAMNATATALSSFSSWGGILITTGILALILAILFIVFSSRSMSSAI